MWCKKTQPVIIKFEARERSHESNSAGKPLKVREIKKAYCLLKTRKSNILISAQEGHASDFAPIKKIRNVLLQASKFMVIVAATFKTNINHCSKASQYFLGANYVHPKPSAWGSCI